MASCVTYPCSTSHFCNCLLWLLLRLRPRWPQYTSESSIYLGLNLLSWRSEKQWARQIKRCQYCCKYFMGAVFAYWAENSLPDPNYFLWQLKYSLLVTQFNVLLVELNIFMLEKVLSQNFIVHHIHTADWNADVPTKPLCKWWLISSS
jgi:hypothetical protein